MTLEAYSTIYKNPKTGQLVITIPSKLATDSNFELKEGDTVKIRVLPQKNILMIFGCGK